MNPKPIFNLFSLKGPGGIQRRLPALVIGSMALLLLAVTACTQAAASGPVTEASLPVEAVDAAMVTEVEDTTSPAFLSINPELLKVQSAVVVVRIPESTLLAHNPELLLARRNMLPENEVDLDRDIGLLEFFTRPNETGGQRAIQRNTDEDIGLLEFFGP